MPIYIFYREGFFYPIEEEDDEKVLEHVDLNPGTKKIETLEGRVVYQEPKLN
jgi:hypothetical protein